MANVLQKREIGQMRKSELDELIAIKLLQQMFDGEYFFDSSMLYALHLTIVKYVKQNSLVRNTCLEILGKWGIGLSP